MTNKVKAWQEKITLPTYLLGLKIPTLPILEVPGYMLLAIFSVYLMGVEG